MRRFVVLGLVAGIAAIVVGRRRRSSTPPSPPTWPTKVAEVPSASSPSPPTPTWLAPIDGRCPEGFPIKANDNSGIYHVPGGRFYDRTAPERCYATAAEADRDGYRAAKA